MVTEGQDPTRELGVLERYQLGEALLSVQVADRRITVHRDQTRLSPGTKADISGDEGAFWLVSTSGDGVSCGPISGAEGFLILGKYAVMFGVLPSESAKLEVIIDGVGAASVCQAEGAFLVVVPSRGKLTYLIRDATDRLVQVEHIDRIPGSV